MKGPGAHMPKGPDPWIPVFFVLLALVGMVAVLALQGCGSTREESHHEATEVARRFTVKGQAEIPTTRPSDGATVFLPLSVDLVIDGGGTDETTGEARARTQLEAPELAGAVVAGLKQAFPLLCVLGAGQPQMGPGPSGWSNTDTGLLTTTGLAIAAMLQRHNAAKTAQEDARNEAAQAEAERRRADEHKADAAEGWAHAMAAGKAKA